MIKSIKFKKDFRTFKQGDEFTFKPGVNVLVGDQGSGKSTLIELIRSSFEVKGSDSDSSWRAKTITSHHKIDDLVEIVADKDSKVMGFDFERESPRDMSMFHHDMIQEQIYAMNASHGQGNMTSLARLMQKFVTAGNVNIVLMDEPDAAMSPRSCYALLGILSGLNTKFNAQVIVSAHNPIIINGIHPLAKDQTPMWEEVLSLEYKSWLTSRDFMIDQLLPPLTADEKAETKTKKPVPSSSKKKK